MTTVRWTDGKSGPFAAARSEANIGSGRGDASASTKATDAGARQQPHTADSDPIDLRHIVL
jgi:hypothetical protein